MRAFMLLFFSVSVFAQRQQQQTSYVGQTQERRQTQRFSMYDWLMNNKKIIAAQDAKYGVGSKVLGGPFPDLVIQYRSDHAYVQRDHANLGEDDRGTARVQFMYDDLIMGGNKTRTFNIDLGLEGFYSKSVSFKSAETVAQVSHSTTETGGGLLIRPYGRSSQDTGLIIKGGYLDVDYTGVWENSDSLKKVWGFYLGGEAKLYLLPFLGLFGDYLTTLEQNIEGLNGKWNMYRFIYGAFIEVYLLNLQAYFIDTEYGFTPNGGAKTKEFSKGFGFGAILHF